MARGAWAAGRGLLAAALLLVALATADVVRARDIVVDNETITGYDIDQRSRFDQLATHKAPPRQQVIDELRQETPVIDEARGQGIDVPDADVDQAYANMAARMHMTAEQLTRRSSAAGHRCAHAQTANTRRSRLGAVPGGAHEARSVDGIPGCGLGRQCEPTRRPTRDGVCHVSLITTPCSAAIRTRPRRHRRAAAEPASAAAPIDFGQGNRRGNRWTWAHRGMGGGGIVDGGWLGAPCWVRTWALRSCRSATQQPMPTSTLRATSSSWSSV